MRAVRAGKTPSPAPAEHLRENPLAREPILTRPFLVTALSQHLFFVAFYSTLTALPLFLADRTSSEIGLVIGALGITSIVAGPLSGRFADRYGRRKMMLLGAASSALLYPAYALTTNLWLLLAIRLAHGAVMQFFATANTALIADIAPASRRAEAMGFVSFFNTAAQIYSPWAGLFLATTLGFEWYWGATTAVVIACTVMASTTRDRHAPSPEPSPLFARSALLPFLVFIGFTTGYGALSAFLTPFAQGGLGDAGIWFLVFGVSMLVVRINAGRLADRVGRTWVIIPGAVAFCGGFVLMGLVQLPAVFLVSAVLAGAGFAAAHTSLLALTIDRAAPAERGAAIAFFFLAWGVGSVLGTIPMGILADAAGNGATFVLSGLLALAGIPLLIRHAIAAPRAAATAPALATNGARPGGVPAVQAFASPARGRIERGPSAGALGLAMSVGFAITVLAGRIATAGARAARRHNETPPGVPRDDGTPAAPS